MFCCTIRTVGCRPRHNVVRGRHKHLAWGGRRHESGRDVGDVSPSEKRDTQAEYEIRASPISWEFMETHHIGKVTFVEPTPRESN